jgi:hypothetical protein
MKFHLFAATLAWATNAMAAPSMSKGLEKRYPTGSFSLIAYGVAKSAVKVFYSDGDQSSPSFSGLPPDTILRACVCRRLFSVGGISDY